MSSIKLGLEGRYKLQAYNPVTKEMRESAWIKNLITDYALNLLCSGGAGFNSLQTWCGVGSSGTAPINSNTALGSQIGSRTNTKTYLADGNIGSPTYYQFRRDLWEFPLGGIVGNVAEVALFNTSTTATALTHSLVKDSGGTPTTFPVLSTEILYIIYECRVYPELTDIVSNITLGGTSYAYTFRATKIDSPTQSVLSYPMYGNSVACCRLFESNVIQPLTSVPAGSAVSATSLVVNSYISGTFERTVVFTFNPSTGNFATGLGAIHMIQQSSTDFGHAIYFNPVKVPKNNTKTLTWTVTYKLERV